MQIWLKFLSIIKLLAHGFYKEGIMVLLKSILEHWLSVCIILGLLIYLCSNSKTYLIAWLLIGIVALFAVIKAIYEIILLLIKYKKTTEKEEKNNIIMLIGGRIFDIALSAVGILQAGMRKDTGSEVRETQGSWQRCRCLALQWVELSGV